MTCTETIADLLALWSSFETWRDVEGFPQYAVSSFGRVRNQKNGKVLAFNNVCGYHTVCLSLENVQKTFRVNRLVALHFLGPPPFDGMVVAHNDGTKTNNFVSNLRWATGLDNQADRKRHGTMTRGSDIHNSKLREIDIPLIRSRIATGERYGRIAADYGVSISTIHLIKVGKI